MDFLPLELSIARPVPQKAPGGSPKIPAGAPHKKLPVELRQKIYDRDDYTCRCCGFKSKKYQEIHFINHNKKDMSEKNLATTCIFCHQCFNLEDVSIMRSGALLWLPEIEQKDLHHIARAVYVARISQGPVAEAARKTLDVLMTRREEARRRISTDDPYILATVLRDYLGFKHYQMKDKKLEGLRLFPLDRRIIKEADLEFNQFPQILAYWRSKDGPFGKKTPQQWVSIYQDIARAA
jgi:intracellular multiplication protein IcmJ